ncbi:MAG: helix-turn-helix domain-containing protein [Phycicoccus sp.]|nr:helix-turn-helix domain-containing protein [Phycicoccus sp.]
MLNSDLLDTADAATLTGVSQGVLANLRWMGTGPFHVRHRGRIFYRRGDLLRWMRERAQSQ